MGMEGCFRLEQFALSPSQRLLAMAIADSSDSESTLVWIADLEHGDVIFHEVSNDEMPSHMRAGRLSFSSNGQVLAVVTAGEDEVENPIASLRLLEASSAQSIVGTHVVGQQVFPAPHVTAFVLPRYRMLLFQSSCDVADGEGYIVFHVPGVGKDSKHVEHHSYALPLQKHFFDRKHCTVCNSLPLDGGSLSPCGTLYVTLGSAGPEASHVMLEHWQMDYDRKLCRPQVVRRVELGCGARELPGNTGHSLEEEAEAVHLHVAWHPLFAEQLIYAIAVEECMGMVHIVDGCTLAILAMLEFVGVGLNWTDGPVSQIVRSPDGSKLAVRTGCGVHIVAFGSR